MEIAPKPPPKNWERYTAAALRHGIPPNILKAHIQAGAADIRTAVLGRRGLLHVASDDVDLFAARLASIR